MSLKAKIEVRLKAKAAGVNLSKKRIEAIVARAEKGLTDESDDTLIDERLDEINELAPFKDMAALDDHERAKAKKEADDREAARLKAIEEGKTPEPDANPNETPTEKLLRQALAGITALTAEVASIKGEKVTNTRKSIVEQKLANSDDKFKATTLKAFGRMKFETEEEFNEYVAELENDAKDFVKVDGSDDGIGEIFRPAGGAGGSNASTKKEATEAEVDAAFSNLRI